MKEHPILFSGEMVRAILDGKKTQTRRVIKPQPEAWVTQVGYTFFTGEGEISFRGMTPNGLAEYCVPLKYRKGDRLWVREAWFADPPYDGTWDQYAFSDGVVENFSVLPDRFKSQEFVLYKATWQGVDLRWRSSIHMPRWASRITLEVVSVRAERVQEISEEDAKAEGILPYPDVGVGVNYLLPYRNLWESINARRGYGWSINPWVWVIEFKRIKP